MSLEYFEQVLGPAWPAVWTLLKIAAIVLPLLGAVAYLTLWERKVIGWMQVRLGPNRVTFFGIRWLGGLAQPIADGLKLLLKEIVVPTGANRFLFVLAPIMAFMPALAAWAVIPVNEDGWGKWVISDLNVGVLYLLALSSLAVYGIIMGGWASNSKYPFMGSLRSAAQMVSYEVSIGFVIITVILCVGSLNLTDIVNAQKTGIGTHTGLPASALDWYWLALFPMFWMGWEMS